MDKEDFRKQRCSFNAANPDLKPPVFYSVISPGIDRIYKNGDNLTLIAELNEEGANLSLNLTNIESSAIMVQGNYSGNGMYTVKHKIQNIPEDKKYYLPLIGIDTLNNAGVDSSFWIIIDNSHPFLNGYNEEEAVNETIALQVGDKTIVIFTTNGTSTITSSDATANSLNNVSDPYDEGSFSASNIKGLNRTIQITASDESAIVWPVQLRIEYDEAELSALGISEDQLVGIFYWNHTNHEWQLVNETGVNTADNYLWANLYHLSEYAPGSDTTSPITTDVSVVQATTLDVNINLTANITDPVDVNWSNIVMAEYFINNVSGNMTALDGIYDSKSEIVFGIIDVSSLALGNYTVFVHGLDENNNWGNFSNATFAIINSPPRIALNNLSFDEDSYKAINLSEFVTDIDSDTGDINWSYHESANLTININTDLMNVSADKDFYGIRETTITAYDGINSTNKTVTITVNPINDAPAISAVPNQNAVEDINMILNVSQYISDIDDNISELIITTSSPYASTNGQSIIFNYSNSALTGRFTLKTVEITVSDSILSDSQNITINITNTNDNPVLSAITDKTAVESLPLTFNLTAIDEDPTNDVLVFGADSSLGNFRLNSTTGVVSFTPDYADIGVYQIEYNVSDGNGGTDSKTAGLTVKSALEISDLDIQVNGTAYNNLENGAIIDAKPGSSIQAGIELKNMIGNSIKGIIVNGTIDSSLGLVDEAPLISSIDSQGAVSVILQFDLPNIIGETIYSLIITGIGEDDEHVIRRVERTIFINVSKEGNDVIVEGVSLNPDVVSCIKDATLRFNITNKGRYDQDNGNNIKVINEQLGINIEDNFTVSKNSSILKSYALSIAHAEAGVFPIMINVTWFYTESIIKTVDMEIMQCIDIQDYSINEDTAPPSGWVDLWSYTSDPNYADDYFTYRIESQSNESLINCSVSSNRYIDCSAPAENQNGYSSINVSVSNSSVSYDLFKITINPVNDAPVISSIPDISFDEGSTGEIDLNDYVEDIDNNDNELNWNWSGNENVIVSIDSYNVAGFSTVDEDWYGSETILFNVRDPGSLSDSDSMVVTVNQLMDDSPSIAAFSPGYDPLIGDNVLQNFNITVTDPDSINPAISWYVDGALNQSGISASFLYSAFSNYILTVIIANATSDNEHTWNVAVSKVPVTSYSGTINNVNESNVGAFSGLTIENFYASIDFGSEAINLSEVVDVDKYVNIGQNVVGIDSDAPGFEVFKNHPAWIVMRNLSYLETPTIFYNNGFSTAGSTECPSSICSNISYSSGTLTFYVMHFSTFFIAEPNYPPEIVSSPAGTATVNELYSYDMDANDPENDLLAYSLITNPIGMAINSNNGIISWTPDAVGLYNITARVSDNNSNIAEQSFSINVKEGKKLRIRDLDVKVGSKNSKDLNNGAKISRDAKPGDNVGFDIELENIYSSESDIEIRDVEVTVTIKDIDDGDDLEEYADIGDIDAGDHESANIEFTVPTLVESGLYNVMISVEGEDENGNNQDIEWELTLEVKKDRHALLLDNANLNPMTVRCSRNPTLSIKVINIGREDEDDISVEIMNSDMGLSIKDSAIELDEGDDEDSVFKKTYNLKISDELESDTYPISIKVYYGGILADEATQELSVEDCISITTPVTSPPAEIAPPSDIILSVSGTTGKTPPVVSEILFRDTSGYVTLLAITVIILLGLIIFLAGAIIIALKK